MEAPVVIKKKPRIVCNVGDTQYEVVKHVAKKKLSWHLNEDFFDDEWDLEWTDNAVSPDKLSKMRPYQKINHFPGMYGICKKNYLAWNLNRLWKLFPNEYNFYPKTWVLPGDWIDLKNNWGKNKFFILKPEASCQGKGIFLVNKIEEVNPNERLVAQEYLKEPLLIDGLKFDLRIYVLVAGCSPLRVYIHDQGLARLATEPFCPPNVGNMQDMCMHLTNYAINKNSSKFVFNEDPDADDVGHKRSLVSIFEYLQGEGYETKPLMKNIEDIIMKTLCSVQPYLAHLYKTCQPEDYSNSMCFELLGFDIILDSSLKPWVLEVNHSPSFSTDSPLDWKIKKKVIRDTLQLLGVRAKTRKKYFLNKKAEVLKRAMTGKCVKETKEERAQLSAIAQATRDKWENAHLGGFRKLFPCDDADRYQGFIKGANDIYTELTGTNIKRIKKTQEDQKSICLPKTAKNNIRKTIVPATSPNKIDSISFPEIGNEKHMTQLQSEDPLHKREISPLHISKRESPNTQSKCETFLNKSCKVDEKNKGDIFESFENRLTLVQHIQEAMGRNYIKYKSIEVPSLHIHSIKLNKPSLKQSDYTFSQGNYVMPRTFEFSPRIKLPNGLRNQERRNTKYKLA